MPEIAKKVGKERSAEKWTALQRAYLYSQVLIISLFPQNPRITESTV